MYSLLGRVPLTDLIEPLEVHKGEDTCNSYNVPKMIPESPEDKEQVTDTFDE